MSDATIILRFSRDIKIKCLRNALEQNKFGVFVGLSRILLEAPISEGGLETEVIEKIHNDYLQQNNQNKV